MGVIVYGVQIKKTDIQPLCDEENKTVLENFVKSIVPQRNTEKVIDDLDKGLRTAEELLNSVNGTKEIIVFSDGIMIPEGFDTIKKTVINLKNNEIKMQFVQVLLSYEKLKEPNKLYNELAMAADGQVIVLDPSERLTIPKSTPTITPAIAVSPISTGAQIAPPTPIPTSQLEQEVKELKERLNKTEEKQRQLENKKSMLESAINSLIDWFKSIF